MKKVIILIFIFLMGLCFTKRSSLIELGKLWILYKAYKTATQRSYVRLVNTRRKQFGEFHTLIRELRLIDKENYFKYFRMSRTIFDYLLNLIKPHIQHKLTHRFPIGPAERLAITLRLLATGDSQQTVAFSYRIGVSTVNYIFYETLDAIYKVLQPVYLKVPNQNEWKSIAKDFMNNWQFPLCLGAIDGKHISIRAPPKSGSKYYNYKSFFSIVLMAVVDANYSSF